MRTDRSSRTPATPARAALASLVSRLRPRGLLAWARRVAGLVVLGLVGIGIYQAFIATTPATQHTVTLTQAPIAGAVDIWRSHGNGAVRLTTAAVVELDGPGGPAQRVLYDVPAAAKVGDHLPAWVSADGLQVRTGPLPGPAVLPGAQGAALLMCSLAWMVLHLLLRRRRKPEATT